MPRRRKMVPITHDDDGNPLSPSDLPKYRHRAILSCTQCRQRKLKCDRQQPCSRCARSGEECRYIPNSIEHERRAPRRQIRSRNRPVKACTECRRRRVRCDLHEPCSECNARELHCEYEPFPPKPWLQPMTNNASDAQTPSDEDDDDDESSMQEPTQEPTQGTQVTRDATKYQVDGSMDDQGRTNHPINYLPLPVPSQHYQRRTNLHMNGFIKQQSDDDSKHSVHAGGQLPSNVHYGSLLPPQHWSSTSMTSQGLPRPSYMQPQSFTSAHPSSPANYTPYAGPNGYRRQPPMLRIPTQTGNQAGSSFLNQSYSPAGPPIHQAPFLRNVQAQPPRYPTPQGITNGGPSGGHPYGSTNVAIRSSQNTSGEQSSTNLPYGTTNTVTQSSQNAMSGRFSNVPYGTTNTATQPSQNTSGGRFSSFPYGSTNTATQPSQDSSGGRSSTYLSHGPTSMATQTSQATADVRPSAYSPYGPTNASARFSQIPLDGRPSTGFAHPAGNPMTRASLASSDVRASTNFPYGLGNGMSRLPRSALDGRPSTGVPYGMGYPPTRSPMAGQPPYNFPSRLSNPTRSMYPQYELPYRQSDMKADRSEHK